MDERLDKIIIDMFPQIKAFNERFIKLGASIQNSATLDGKVLKDVLDSKSITAFLLKDFRKLQFSKQMNRSDLTFFATGLNGFSERYSSMTKDYYHYNVLNARTIILSIKDLIPSKLNKKHKKISRYIIAASDILLEELNILDNIIQDAMNDNCQKVLESKRQDMPVAAGLLEIKRSALIHALVGVNFLTMTSIHFHRFVHEFFYGPDDKKKENEEMLRNFCSSFFSFESKLSSIENYTKAIDKKTDDLLKEEEETQRMIDAQGNQASSKLEVIEDKVDKKDRAGRTKPLKLTTCLEAIREVYDDPIYGYYSEFDLHVFAIRNMLSNWNQYLNTDGKKGKPPLPKFDFYRHTDKDTFKKWVRDYFFPDYRNRAHKDALDNASHPDMNNMGGVSSEEDIYDEVEQSLANDSNNATENAPNNTTKNEQSDSPSNGHK